MSSPPNGLRPPQHITVAAEATAMAAAIISIIRAAVFQNPSTAVPAPMTPAGAANSGPVPTTPTRHSHRSSPYGSSPWPPMLQMQMHDSRTIIYNQGGPAVHLNHCDTDCNNVHHHHHGLRSCGKGGPESQSAPHGPQGPDGPPFPSHSSQGAHQAATAPDVAEATVADDALRPPPAEDALRPPPAEESEGTATDVPPSAPLAPSAGSISLAE